MFTDIYRNMVLYYLGVIVIHLVNSGPVAAAHVCVPLAIGFVYEWWTQVSAAW